MHVLFYCNYKNDRHSKGSLCRRLGKNKLHEIHGDKLYDRFSANFFQYFRQIGICEHAN